MFYSLINYKYYKYKIQNYIIKKHEWRLCMGSLESMITVTASVTAGPSHGAGHGAEFHTEL